MPLDVGIVLDIKYLPEEDVLAIVSQCGSISLYNLTSSEVNFSFLTESLSVKPNFVLNYSLKL